MAILIDPPSWPAHGTVFSHLVSTASLEELHAFAVAAGISRRAFDEDHYDVPAQRYRELVDRGALEVSGADLVRALIRSGLRVPARRRGPRLRAALRSRWERLRPDDAALGEELLDRWNEPHRTYHSMTHLLAVLEALDRLLEPSDARLRDTVLLAAWFHDAVHHGMAGEDERRSAALAVERLRGAVDESVVRGVERLVLLTIGHDPEPGDRAGELLCDADLSVLGSAPEDYVRYTTAIRREYASVPDADFVAGRRAVLQRLMALDPLYRSDAARGLWSESAGRNLARELALLVQR